MSRHAGDIGLFRIISETGVASGVRRIEAVTGARALQWVHDGEQRLARVAGLVKGGREDVDEKVGQLLDRYRTLEKELQQLKGKLASSQGTDLAAQAVVIDGMKVLAARLDGADAKALRDTLDQLKNKLGSAAVVLAAVDGDKVSLVAGVTKTRPAGSRRATWSTWWRPRSAARAAGVRTWRRPAATSPTTWTRPCSRCRTGCDARL